MRKQKEFTINLEVAPRPPTMVELHSLIVKSSNTPQIKRTYRKTILLLPEYYQTCTCNITFNTKANLCTQLLLGTGAHERYGGIN